jgi:hypothetical protein
MKLMSEVGVGSETSSGNRESFPIPTAWRPRRSTPPRSLGDPTRPAEAKTESRWRTLESQTLKGRERSVGVSSLTSQGFVISLLGFPMFRHIRKSRGIKTLYS